MESFSWLFSILYTIECEIGDSMCIVFAVEVMIVTDIVR
jgi:hypothetical protein